MGLQEDMAMANENLVAHEDLSALLWWNDGPKKNYTIQHDQHAIYRADEVVAWVDYPGSAEPSAISTNAPVHFPSDSSRVQKFSYYPDYSKLTAEQRGIYWKFLENPYEGNTDIGCVFLLFYGLERHLVEGDFEAAVKVILSLRKVFDHPAFQSYSANTLIISFLIRQRLDLIQQFIASLEKNHMYQLSCNLYAICKYLLGLPLTPDDLIRMAKDVGFNNLNYIKKYPTTFALTLANQMEDLCGVPHLDIHNYFKTDQWNDLEKYTVAAYANVSLNTRWIDLPFLLGYNPLKETIQTLLHNTHEAVKAELRRRRKDGESVAVESEPPARPQHKLQFDVHQEKQLLQKYKLEMDVVKRHFVCIDLQTFYYKYRSLSDTYIDKCIQFCYEDIEVLPELDKAYANGKVTNMFIGTIPAFSRLAIIYEKRKDFIAAEKICNMAIDYYIEHGKTAMAELFFERCCRLHNKRKE